MNPDLRALLDTTMSGSAILFTGAGFSQGMRDRRGRRLPTSAEMAAELWRHLFGDDPQDDSSLADLFDVALQRDREAVEDYLQERFTVDDDVPWYIAAWFAAPWRRIYTLNVDDLEAAVDRCCRLPHRPEVVHLNGRVGQPIDQVTFSTLQYAARLCDRQPAYEQLAIDLEQSPFVFVGTTLDEVVLWKHVQLERSQSNDEAVPRRHSFLISPSLTKARQTLLEAHRIHWVRGTAAEIANNVLSRLQSVNERSKSTAGG
jgi:hypothetical protein